MAANITLLGANYPNVPAVILPRTGGGTAKFIEESEIVKQPDVLNATRTALTSGTVTAVTSDGSWYAVRAINSSASGGCAAYIQDSNGSAYYAAVAAKDGTYQRAMTPWIYFPSGKKFYVRAIFTDSDDSGLLKAAANW